MHDNVALLPLRGVDNQLIPNFPVNISRRMDEMALNGILTSLGVQLPQDGGIELKRRMVARYIGLVVTLSIWMWRTEAGDGVGMAEGRGA